MVVLSSLHIVLSDSIPGALSDLSIHQQLQDPARK